MRAPRRAFLGALAVSPLATASGGSTQPAPAPAPPREASAAEGLLAAARSRFGHHLAPGDVDELRKGIEHVLRAGERLRAHPLVNADEPVGLFEARPAAGRPRGR